MLSRLLDYRFLYIGVTSRRRWLVWPYAFKIGIAKNVGQRWRDIDRSIPRSKERPIFFARLFFAGRVEQHLLNTFARKKARFHGSGRSEWRKLNIFDLLYCFTVIMFHSLIGLIAIVLALLWLYLSYQSGEWYTLPQLVERLGQAFTAAS